jgi:hypothetical protein
VDLPVAARLAAPDSFLRTGGWYASVQGGLPVAADGAAIPWFTYPAISFLGPRLKKEMRVFEYGSGNSTRWWSSRVAEVVSCEHDRSWYERMKPLLPANVDYRHFELVEGGAYSREILSFRDEFDIVVIDGRDRVNCALNCLGALRAGGVVVWDNSDRDIYAEGYEFLVRAGFRRIDFWGMGPINTYAWCTSVFYRPENCLAI